MKHDEIAAVLPIKARLALVSAAKIEPTKGRTESQERTMVLDHTIREIKSAYPNFFNKGTKTCR